MTPTFTYPNPYQQNYPTTPYHQKSDPSNGITWVQGIEGAKAYQMLPNSNIQLLDSENDGIFYIKVTDNIGMASLRIFHYTEITAQEIQKTSKHDLSEYVKKSELGELIKSILAESEVGDEQSLSATPTVNKPKPNVKG